METQGRCAWVAPEARQILEATHGSDSIAVRTLEQHEALLIGVHEAIHPAERDEINDRLDALRSQDPELFASVLGARQEAVRRRVNQSVPAQR